jgi:hypothetical protein
MTLILPTWFKQRQGKAEPAGPDIYRLSGPNLREGWIAIRRAEDGRWSAGLRFTADGPDDLSTQSTVETPGEAWDQGFELYRTAVVV